nr:MAG: RNA-dependent RNA-polymerase [Picobirnavirus sp.]
MKKLTLSAQELQNETKVQQFGVGLSPYLMNLSRGRSMTPRSWLYERKDAQSVLEEWIKIMETANNKTEFGEKFSSFDLKQVEKFGPQGGIPPVESKQCWDVINPLYSSVEYDNADQLKEWFPAAEEFASVVFGSANLLRRRPLSPEAVVKDMARRDTLTANSGYPRFSRRVKMQKDEVQDARSLRAYGYPAIVLFRYYYGKLRPVWMFPMSTNLIEASYALQIQSCIAQSPAGWVRDYCTPWKGFDHVKSVLTEQWPSTGAIVGGDTTKMDAHMRKAQMQLVFEIVKWLFQRQYWDDLRQSILHVNEIDLLIGMNDGKYVKLEGVHGLASGSSWTQLSETVLQLFMAYVKGVQGQGIGDDFYWISNMSADALVGYLEQFGLPANPKKQSVETTNLTFLQRYFHQGFFSRESSTELGAYYPTIRALGSLLYPEKFHDPRLWNSSLFCVRTFSILENCVDDPCFDEFVEFVARGQKDLIPFAKSNAKQLAGYQKLARSVPGLLPNYNQEKMDRPLSAYTSIRLAAQL